VTMRSRADGAAPGSRRSDGRGSASRDRPGAFVCSLDFELLWGVRDLHPADGGAYRENLLGARRAIPAILELFERHRIHATWATVGFLFASSREELRAFSPRERPAYADPRLSPYGDPLGADEREDPLRFGASLVARIRERPGQEIGTHTFSHYYCLEPGQTLAAFTADLDAAVRIAAARGIRLRSIVFPRNQVNEAYAATLRSRGIVAMRGNVRGWAYRSGTHAAANGAVRRAARMLDAYLPLSGLRGTGWDEIVRPDGLCDVPASLFLRPYAPRLRAFDGARLARIAAAVRHAARSGRVFHLWWHPHNFGRHLAENLAFLEGVLRVVGECRSRHGMGSLSMGEVAAGAAHTGGGQEGWDRLSAS
jgi:peptidoglycan/xylan/chitin deacetylase (PgdA/CDA1 family)